ncbi:MAG: alpha-amylase family glycosyl hydrolase [Sandaracinaceae bacterium]|nr:MAG: alpha-amylase [Sandaracinaceae bacterium]
MTRRFAILLLATLSLSCAHDALGDQAHVEVQTHVDDWRDQIIYQLLVDRFANGDAHNDWRVDPTALARYQGGDWQGVIDQLDYLEALGVTALWISPVVLNVDTDAGIDGYHGYWAVDFTRVNPHFGDLATLRRLVDECHARGMLIILDIVTNHLGQVFYYDVNQNGQPDESTQGSGSIAPGGSPTQGTSPVARINEFDPDFDIRGIQSFTSLGPAGPAPVRFFDMPEIFRVPPQPAIFQDPNAYNRRGRTLNFDIEEQLLLGDFPGGLKDVNTRNAEVREAMVQVYVDWVLQTDLDGFRIDTIKHVEYEFWEFFAPEVRRRVAAAGKTNFFMFGEAFDGRDDLIGSFTQPGRLDSVFYFSQKFRVFDDVFRNGGPTSNIQRLLEERAVNYGQTPQEGGIGVSPDEVLVNFLDNHDVPRFLFENDGEEGVRELHAALTYLFTEDGIPCLYYGTEQRFNGGNDPSNREPLWRSGYATDGETFQHIARLSRIRRHYRALTHGSFELVWVSDRSGDESDAGVLAFERRTPEGEYALVVINARSDKASRTSFEGAVMEVTARGTLRDVLGDASFGVGADGLLDVELGPNEAVILVPEAEHQAF